MLKINIQAPEFTLSDKDGQKISLSDFKGKKVVLYFYPKDDTPGCTKQACGFAAHQLEFEQEAAVIIGVSKDNEKSHQRFASKYNLPFILLSDPELEVIKSFDVWKERKMYGKAYMGVVRTTYVIDENGVIIQADDQVKAESNAEDVLAWLKSPKLQ